MSQLYSNNLSSTVAQEVTVGATTITLFAGSGASFPSPTGDDFFLLTLVLVNDVKQETGWEIVKVTGRSGDVLTVERAQENTSALVWPVASLIEGRVTASAMARGEEAYIKVIEPGSAPGDIPRWNGTDWVVDDVLQVTDTDVTVNGTLLSPGAGTDSFRAGPSAGQTTQGTNAVAIGKSAGLTSQNNNSVAMGNLAGSDTQGASSVAVGTQAAQTTQGNNSVAVGNSAGKTAQSNNSVAVGKQAGETNQGSNGIIINATGTALDDTSAGHIHIASDDGSLDYTTTGKWSMSDDLDVTGVVTATAFVGPNAADLQKEWSSIFGDKPFREAIWLGAATQSLGAPLMSVVDNMPESSRVKDWCSGGIDSYAFRDLTGLDVDGYGDEDSAAPYTGHHRKESYIGTSWPLAVKLAEHFDCDVYVTHTWWSGHGIYSYFYPFTDDEGDSEGDGWTEWAVQSTAAQTALSGATMDLFMFMAGDTDAAMADGNVSAEVERYHDFINMSQNELGVMDTSTRHVFYDQSNNTASWDQWRIYRAMFRTWAGADRATYVASGDYDTFEGVHPFGDQQLIQADLAFDTLIMGGGKSVATEEFNRSHQPLSDEDPIVRGTDHVTPGTVDKQFTLNAAKTQLVLPWEWYTGWFMFGTIPVPTGEGPVGLQNLRSGMRVTIKDLVTGADSQQFTLTDDGVWDNSLPNAHGTPNHKVFSVTAGATTGTGLPAAAEPCSVSIKSSLPGEPYVRWPRSGPTDNEGGESVTTRPTFYRNFRLPSVIEEGNPVGLGSAVAGDVAVPFGSILIVGANGIPVDSIEATTGVYARTQVFTMTKVGAFEQDDFGLLGVDVANDQRCLIDATIQLSGRRTDDTGAGKIYGGTYRYMSHYHVANGMSGSGTNYAGIVSNEVNPDNEVFQQVGGWNVTAGTPGANYLIRGSVFFPPTASDATYDWTAHATYVITVY